MNNFKFIPEVRIAFEKAGWFPDRNIQSKLIIPLKYDYPENVLMLLYSIGNIKVDFAQPAVRTIEKKISLDPFCCIEEISAFEYWEDLTGIKLFAIGELLSENSFLAVDKDLGLYEFDDFMIRFGSPFDNAINNYYTYNYFQSYEPSDNKWITKPDRSNE